MSGFYAAPAFDAGPTTVGVPPQFGEPVIVTPRHANALDDGVFACHAIFAWREATTTVAGNVLRYRSYRPTASFDGDLVRCSLRPGDRITRSWDGAIFEVTFLHRQSRSLRCDLVELDRRVIDRFPRKSRASSRRCGDRFEVCPLQGATTPEGAPATKPKHVVIQTANSRIPARAPGVG